MSNIQHPSVVYGLSKPSVTDSKLSIKKFSRKKSKVQATSPDTDSVPNQTKFMSRLKIQH